jgi:hypothetical protein
LITKHETEAKSGMRPYLSVRYEEQAQIIDEANKRVDAIIARSRLEAERMARSPETHPALHAEILNRLIVTSHGLQENNLERYRQLAFIYAQTGDIGNALPYIHFFVTLAFDIAISEINNDYIRQTFPLYHALLFHRAIENQPVSIQFDLYFRLAMLSVNANYQGGIMGSLQRCMEMDSSRTLSIILQKQYYHHPIPEQINAAFVHYCVNLLNAGEGYYKNWFYSDASRVAKLIFDQDRILLERLVLNQRLQQAVPLFSARAFNLLAEHHPAYYRDAALLYARIENRAGLTFCAREFTTSNFELARRELENIDFTAANPLYARQLTKFLEEGNMRVKHGHQQHLSDHSIFSFHQSSRTTHDSTKNSLPSYQDAVTGAPRG